MRQYMVFLALIMAAAMAFADREVYLGIRADGKEGAGTASDPYDAGAPAKFDRLFAGFGSNTVIHLGPGTYHTKGIDSFSVKPYWKIRGAGYGVTRIIQDLTGKIYCQVFSGTADGVEIEDLSVDCGFQNQQVVNGKIKANASAIGISGSHIAVRRCLINNYGSPYDAETGENFAVIIGGAGNGENLVVEDCIFTGRSPLSPVGASVLTIAGGPPANDLNAGNWARGCVARRNHFTGFHYGCHGITMSGTQGGMIVDNVFEHFMGACIYQDTWPMRDIVIANNIMSDINMGILLAGDNLPMNNFQIRNNLMLMNDGYDIDRVAGGVVKTVINHSLIPGNKIRFHKVSVTSGQGLTADSVFIASVPSPNTFTYSLTASGRVETAAAGTGGFIQALSYQEAMTPAPQAMGIFTGNGAKLFPPTNFIIERNIIKPYSSDDTARVPSVGIAVCGLRNSQITGNMIFDAGACRGTEGFDPITGKVLPDTGQHADLLVSSPKGFTSTVICRDNYRPDGTRLLPRDRNSKIIENGLLDPPFEAGQNVTLTPTNGRIRIAVSGTTPLARPIDPAGPAGNVRQPGKPGDYAVQGGYLYIYTGDGAATHQWKRCQLLDY